MKTTQQPTMNTSSKKFTLTYQVEAEFDVNGTKVLATFKMEAGSMDEARAIVADLVNLNAEVTS